MDFRDPPDIDDIRRKIRLVVDSRLPSFRSTVLLDEDLFDDGDLPSQCLPLDPEFLLAADCRRVGPGDPEPEPLESRLAEATDNGRS